MIVAQKIRLIALILTKLFHWIANPSALPNVIHNVVHIFRQLLCLIQMCPINLIAILVAQVGRAAIIMKNIET